MAVLDNETESNLEYLMRENRRQSLIEDAAQGLLEAMDDYDPQYPEESLVPQCRKALEQILYPKVK